MDEHEVQTLTPPGDPGEEPRLLPDREKFETLAHTYLDALFSGALRLTRNRPDAEDLLQETFLKAWRFFHTYREGTNARAWLFRILMNTYIDGYRKNSKMPERVDYEEVGDFYLYTQARNSEELRDAGNPEALLDQIMDVEVREALESLPPKYRAPVILADIEGFSYKEIAQILHIPTGTVMSRLYRGRHELQKRLWEYAKARYHLNETER